MKKFIITFMAFFFSICMIVPLTSVALTPGEEKHQYDLIRDNNERIQDIHRDSAYNYSNIVDVQGKVNEINDKLNEMGNGASQEAIEELKESVNNIDVKQGVDDYFTEKSNESSGDAAEQGKYHTNALVKLLQDSWAAVPKIIIGKTDGVQKVTLDPGSQKNSTFYGIFVTIGYSLVLVFFAANLIESTIKYEIFTLKGGVQIFGRLIVSKVIIDLSGQICVYILNICNYISKDILKNASDILSFELPNIFENIEASKVPFVGGLIDFLLCFVAALPVLIILCAIFFMVEIVIFKLILRSIELSLLVIVSPAFFACYSSEITKPYFKNFILTFLQCALQIVLMAVVYALSSGFIIDWGNMLETKSAWEWSSRNNYNALIAIAIAFMMIKPPKVLTNLISR